MNLATCLTMACAILSLSSCGTQIPGLPHMEWGYPGPEVRGTVDIPGGTTKRRVSYHASPNRSGATRAKAVKIEALNMIEGDLAELHVLNTRFPKATWRPSWREPDIVVKILFHIYHVYHVTEPDGRTHEFWFDASDYHDFF